jgi:hypothetical protein
MIHGTLIYADGRRVRVAARTNSELERMANASGSTGYIDALGERFQRLDGKTSDPRDGGIREQWVGLGAKESVTA